MHFIATHSRSSHFVALALLLSACESGEELAPIQEQEELPPIREQSEWLVLRGPADLPICEGSFARMEAEVMQISEMFGSGPVTVDYSWMPAPQYHPEDLPCPVGWACASHRNVYAPTLMMTHELVHAARWSLPSVLEEGLATMLNVAINLNTDVMASRELLREAFEAGTYELAPDGQALYERSAHFVSFLFAYYGRDTFLEFEKRVRWETYAHRPLTQWAADFEAVYGESFDQAWETYATYPDCAPAQYHLPLTACSMLETHPPDASLFPAYIIDPGPDATFTRALECGDDGVVGPITFFNGAVTRSASYVIDIDNHFSGMVWFDLTGEITDASRAIITNCGNCWDGAAVFLSRKHPNDGANLQPNLHPHVLTLYRDLDATGEFGIVLRF
jgi:hypothetical protein